MFIFLFVYIFTVQPNTKISAVTESDSGAANYSSANVSVVQAERSSGSQQLHTFDHGDYNLATCC